MTIIFRKVAINSIDNNNLARKTIIQRFSSYPAQAGGTPDTVASAALHSPRTHTGARKA